SLRIGDAPVACLELHGLGAGIGECDRIGPEVADLRRRAIGQETRPDLDLDLTGHGTIPGLDGVHCQPAIPDLGISHGPRRPPSVQSGKRRVGKHVACTYKVPETWTQNRHPFSRPRSSVPALGLARVAMT